jgi:hypothetical protein
MSSDYLPPAPERPEPPTPRLLWLERLTAAVLLAVVLALGWMVAMANDVAWLRLPSPTAEVAVILVLLTAALILVSVVALRHTHR